MSDAREQFSGDPAQPPAGVDASIWSMAMAGDATAQFQVAQAFQNEPADPVRAAEWYRKAAEQGHPLAQSKLGLLYASGDGLPQDDVEAVFWCLKAAEQGIADAQLGLGYMYQCGRGVPQAYVEASEWYLKAADQGSVEAMYCLGALHDEIAHDYAEAATWYRPAAEKGHVGAQHRLGCLYWLGLGLTRDHSNAFFWFDVAASNTPVDDPRREEIVRDWQSAASRVPSLFRRHPGGAN